MKLAAATAIAAGSALAVAPALIAPAPAAADPARPDPIGALGATSELSLTETPRQRLGAYAIYFVTHRAGAYAALSHATTTFDQGQLTAGLAYRAAIARPRIEMVLHADAGVARPTAPTAGAGLITFFWPTRLPLALTSGLRAYAILDGLDHSRLALSLELGLAIAR